MDRQLISQGSAFEEQVGYPRPAATMMVVGLATPAMKIEIEVTARIGHD